MHKHKSLLYIFNQSLQSGIFPDKLKIARVTPSFKKGSDSELGNYRPISVLPCFSKILEKIMYNRLYKHLKEKDILYKKQFGFQQKHSIERNQFTLGIFIDLSKDFDTVDHKILISKLKNYGIRGNDLKWFESYLNNCKQFIVYNNKYTSFETITCCVSQSSVLEPLLFWIYVNDLNQVSNILDPLMFADATNFFLFPPSNKNSF